MNDIVIREIKNGYTVYSNCETEFAGTEVEVIKCVKAAIRVGKNVSKKKFS